MFKDQVIVITGSARGLGFGMARRFGQDGARVVITDLNIAGGEQAAASLRQDGMQAVFASLDVRDPVQSAALVEKLSAEYDHLDVWVNNAGVAYKGPAETLPWEQFDEAVSVMLSGAFYCSQAAGRQMLAQGRGVIINVASTSAYQYIQGRVACSVPKAGLIMLTQALGVEWSGRGVRVVGIAPGVVMTEMVQKGLDEGTARLDLYERRTPLRRLGTVEEIAEAVFWLASDEAAYVVAETLRVDGGWTAYQLF
jgi:NAD(P)-dependent dehydrogenase (short-subunit alcohol dehydrogenase family)